MFRLGLEATILALSCSQRFAVSVVVSEIWYRSSSRCRRFRLVYFHWESRNVSDTIDVALSRTVTQPMNLVTNDSATENGRRKQQRSGAGAGGRGLQTSKCDDDLCVDDDVVRLKAIVHVRGIHKPRARTLAAN